MSIFTVVRFARLASLAQACTAKIQTLWLGSLSYMERMAQDKVSCTILKFCHKII